MYGSGSYGEDPYGGPSGHASSVSLASGTLSVGKPTIGKPTLTIKISDELVPPTPVPVPPPSAERLLCYLLPKHQRESILGDLAEDYRTNFLPKYGPREAWRMYWSHFIRSVAATLPPWIWAAVLGAVGWLWGRLGN